MDVQEELTKLKEAVIKYLQALDKYDALAKPVSSWTSKPPGNFNERMSAAMTMHYARATLIGLCSPPPQKLEAHSEQPPCGYCGGPTPEPGLCSGCRPLDDRHEG